MGLRPGQAKGPWVGTSGGSGGIFYQKPVIDFFDPTTGTPDFEWVLKAWYKGENDTVDTVAGNDAVWKKTVAVIGEVDPAYDTGVVGNCFKFLDYSGGFSKSYIEVPYASAIAYNASDMFALEFYFQQPKLQTEIIAQKSTSYSVGEWNILAQWSSGGTGDIVVSVGGNSQSYPNIWAIDTWYKVRFEYTQSGRWELYLNDIQQVPSAYFVMPVNGANHYPWLFGGATTAPTPYGLIDEIKIYKKESVV